MVSTPARGDQNLQQEGTISINCNIDERRVGGVTVLDLAGEIRTGGSRIVLHNAIGGLLQEGRNQILLNLARLTDIDASGLGELVSSHTNLKRRGGQLKLLHPTQTLREIMKIMRLLTVFDVYEDESEALAGFTELATEGR
jgi:anti-sigma B factor antagonist